MKKLIIILTVSIFTLISISAQRKVTPVENKSTSIQTVEGKKAAKELLDKKVSPSLVFGDSIINLPEENAKDSLPKIKNIYPTFYGLTLGVDIWDPIMRLFNQKYGLFGVSAELNLHNRYLPTIEMGLGKANNTPDDGNYTYTSPLSFYIKFGASYNFLFNKNPDYQFLGGIRFGYTSFKYDITNITVSSDYWGETDKFDILDQKSNAFWGEIVMGIRVKIIQNFSMGWSVRYHFLFNYKKNPNSEPWYIPGYGAKDNDVSGSFSVYYTIPFNQKPIDPKTAKVIKDLNKIPESQNSNTPPSEKK